MAYWMLVPVLVIVLGIIVFPVLWNFALSLRTVGLIELRDLTVFCFNLTLANFTRVIIAWGFWSELWVTVYYSIASALLTAGLGLMVAQMVHGKFRGRGPLRGLFLFPYIAPVIAVAFTWRYALLSPHLGVVNALAVEAEFFAQPIAFLSERPYAVITVILFQGWRFFPFAFLFIQARMQAIPDELYEAAAVDGATPWQKFCYITLPQLRFVLTTVILLRFMWTINRFDDIFLLTGGAGGTTVLPVRVYRFLMGAWDIGAAAALAVILFLVLGFFLLIYFKWVMRGG